MKTTIEIEDDLLRRAKKHAVDEGCSLRSLVEAALREHLATQEHGEHPLAGWGSPEKTDRAAIYDETYHEIIDNIERAMREYDERHTKH